MASFASIAASAAASQSGKPTTSPTNTSPQGGTGPVTLRALVDMLITDAPNVYRVASECVDEVLHPSPSESDRGGSTVAVAQPSTATPDDRFAGMQRKRGGAGVTPSSSAQTAPPKGSREAAPGKKRPAIEAYVAALQHVVETLPAPGVLASGSAEATQTLERSCSLFRGIVLFLATSAEPSPGAPHSASGASSAVAFGSGGPRRGGRDETFRRLTTTSAAAPQFGSTGNDSTNILHHPKGNNSCSIPNLLPVVAAAVVKLSTVGADAITTPRNLAAASRLNPGARSVEQETRALSLLCLTAVAQTQPEAVPLAFPVLFPDIISLPQLLSNSWKHPLLSPFLHDRVYRCRAAAGAAIGQLLQRCALYLQVAAEPSAKDRQSFTSISTGLGRTLRDLHNVALHGLTAATPGAATAAASQHHTTHHHARSLFLHLFSALLSVTPYSRCPESRQCITQKVLTLPLLQDLVGTTPSAAATRSDANEFSAAAQLLGNIWRTKSLRADVLAHVRSSAGKQLINHLVAALPSADASRALLHLVRSFPDALTTSHIDLMIRAGEAVLTRDSAGCANPDGSSAAPKLVADIVEMLRTLMHACGLAWDAFDVAHGEDAEDVVDGAAEAAAHKAKKALRSSANPTPAATSVSLQQKLHIVQRLYLRTLVHKTPAVRAATYKCLAQLGNDVLSLLEPLPTGFEEVDVPPTPGGAASTRASPSVHVDPNGERPSRPCAVPLSNADGEAPFASMPSLTQLVKWVILRGASDDDASVRAEAVLCVGVWAMGAPCCIPLHPTFLRLGMALVANERESEEVRTKAAFLQSNLAAQLNSVQGVVNGELFSRYVVRVCDACAVAMTAASRARSSGPTGPKSLASVLAGHAVRMIPFLLRSLDDTSLIMELEGHPEGVANLFLERLAGYASVGTSAAGPTAPPVASSAAGGAARHPPPPRALGTWDVKTRWNAAFAIGEVVSLPSVYAADPPAARLCVDSLIGVLRGDANFKALTHAMGALVKILRGAPAVWTDAFGDAVDSAASALSRICPPTSGQSTSGTSSQGPDEGSPQPAALSKQEADLRATLLAEILVGLPALLACAPGTQSVQRAIARNRDILASHNLV